MGPTPCSWRRPVEGLRWLHEAGDDLLEIPPPRLLHQPRGRQQRALRQAGVDGADVRRPTPFRPQQQLRRLARRGQVCRSADAAAVRAPVGFDVRVHAGGLR